MTIFASPRSVGIKLARRGRIPGAISPEDLVPGTDITVALQALIDAHDVVYIVNPGTYYLSIAGDDPYVTFPSCYSLLVAKSNFSLHIGEGVTLKLLNNEQLNADGIYNMILFSHRSNITIHGLGTLDSNSQGQSLWTGGYAQNGGHCILGRAKSFDAGCHNITIKDLTLKNTFGNPVNIGQDADCTNVEFNGCKCFTFGEGPQFVKCTDVKVLGNSIVDESGVCQGDGYEFAACKHVVCTGNFAYTESGAGGTAFDLYGSQHVLIANNTIKKWTTGIMSFGFPPGLQRTKDVTITGNTFGEANIGFANIDAMTASFSSNVWVKNSQPFYLNQSPLAVVTITSSGATATVTHALHTYETGDSVIISGAAQSSYNGTFAITVTTANAYTYVLPATAASPATGTIKSRSAYNVTKIVGDVFRLCGVSTITGIGDLELTNCSIENNSNVFLNITRGQSPVDTDNPTVRLTGNVFRRCQASPIQITAIEGAANFAPTLILRNNDFLETDHPPITLFFPNAKADNVTGGGNRGYSLPSESLANQLSAFLVDAPSHDYFDRVTVWSNGGSPKISGIPIYANILSVALAHWPMQEAAGSLIDTRFAYAATTTGSPTYQNAGPTAWYPFAIGTSQNNVFDAGDLAALDLSAGSFSAAAWIYAADMSGYNVPFGKGTNASANNFRCFTFAGTLAFFYGNDAQMYAPNSAPLTNSTWHFCVWGRNVLNGKSFVSLDGVRVETSESVTQVWGNALPLKIGYDGAGYYFTGRMAGLMLFDMPLTDEQITLLMAGP